MVKLYSTNYKKNTQYYSVFTPVLFRSIESNSSLFPPLVWIFWAGVNTTNRTLVGTKQPYRDPAEEVVSARFQTNSGMVEWMNQ